MFLTPLPLQEEFESIERHHHAAYLEANSPPGSPRLTGVGFGGFGRRGAPPLDRGTFTIHRSEGVASGSLHLVCPDQPDALDLRQRIWAEVDDVSFLVWKFADTAPAIFIKLEDIGGVSAHFTKPEGCCFAISIMVRV